MKFNDSKMLCFLFLSKRSFNRKSLLDKEFLFKVLKTKFFFLNNEKKLYLLESLKKPISFSNEKSLMLDKKKLTVSQLLFSKIHIGHDRSVWNFWSSSFLFGERHNQHIINITKSLFFMKKVLKILVSLSNNNGTVLFVSTKTDQARLLEPFLPKNHLFISSSWVGGLLTNWFSLSNSLIQNSLKKEKSLKKLFRKKTRILKMFKGFLVSGDLITKLPDLIIFLNVNENQLAIKEAEKLGIPTIGIVDSNTDCRGLTYSIPGNDDSLESHLFYLQFFKKAITK